MQLNAMKSPYGSKSTDGKALGDVPTDLFREGIPNVRDRDAAAFGQARMDRGEFKPYSGLVKNEL